MHSQQVKSKCNCQGVARGNKKKKKQLSGKKEEGEVSDYRDETWV